MGPLSGGAKERAEGAVFAAAVLPQVHACNAASAKTIYDNMNINGAAVDFNAVKAAFEGCYVGAGDGGRPHVAYNYDPDDALAKRIEIKCGRCRAHLGHVFAEAGRPERHCVNSVCLVREQGAPEGADEGALSAFIPQGFLENGGC